MSYPLFWCQNFFAACRARTGSSVDKEVLNLESTSIRLGQHRRATTVDKEPPRVSLRDLQARVSLTGKELPRANNRDHNTTVSTMAKETCKEEESTNHRDSKELERQLRICMKQLRVTSQVNKRRPFQR